MLCQYLPVWSRDFCPSADAATGNWLKSHDPGLRMWQLEAGCYSYPDAANPCKRVVIKVSTSTNALNLLQLWYDRLAAHKYGVCMI